MKQAYGRARYFPAVVLTVLLATACAGDEQGDAESAESSGAAGAAQSAGSAADQAQPQADGGLRMVVTGGAAAGTHEAAGETTCVHTQGTWIASFSEYGRVEAQAVLNGVGADGGSSEDVQFTATVGDVMSEQDPGAMLTLAPGMAGLTGAVTLDGDAATVTVEGTTADNSAIDARFTCSEVQR